MDRTMRHIVVVMMFLGCSTVAMQAYGTGQPVIVNTGEGTAFTNPGFVEFMFVRHITDGTIEIALDRCKTFLEAAPKAIRGSELQPTEIITAPPIITSVTHRQVQASFTVRFSMTVFNTADTGPKNFAALCDKLNDLAKTMKCTLAPPVFYAANPDDVMAMAVARATENAYPAAEAVADAVKTNIYAVDRVEVIEVEWDQQPKGQRGDVPQIACHAKVEVTYALAPQ